MKVFFYTLGCKVNQYDTQAMLEAFASKGHTAVGSDEPADIYVINSCTVTAESDRKTRQAVRRFKKQNPESLVILTGCMPQAYPEEADSLSQADIVLGNKNYPDLLDLVEEYFSFGQRRTMISPHKSGEPFELAALTGFDQRTRAIVKIEEGCDRFCSYCIIPYARGRVRSKPLDQLEKEISSLAKAGFLELVLVGINLSAYGSDFGASLFDAVKTACYFDSVKRVRLGSLEPQSLNDSLIEQLTELEKLCPHFHISLQSGCDKTLKAMNRGYSTDDFRRVCNKLRQTFPDCTLTTDVMVGFPGESDQDFKDSLEFIKEIAFEKVHVFPYSVRPGTKAEKMPNRVLNAEKEKRSRLMAAAAQISRTSFLQEQVGKVLEILVEEEDGSGYSQGYTANYTHVRIKGAAPKPGNFCRVKIEDADDDFCYGKVID